MIRIKVLYVKDFNYKVAFLHQENHVIFRKHFLKAWDVLNTLIACLTTLNNNPNNLSGMQLMKKNNLIIDM